MVRDEVLRRLTARLPPEMQLLDAALGAADSKARMVLLRTYARLSADELPPAAEHDSGVPTSSGSGAASSGTSLHCLASDLDRAANQLISDMELMLAVPDRWVGRGWAGGWGIQTAPLWLASIHWRRCLPLAPGLLADIVRGAVTSGVQAPPGQAGAAA
jgi:hypothetical protein